MTIDSATHEAAQRLAIARHALELEVADLLAKVSAGEPLTAERITVLRAILTASQCASAQFHAAQEGNT